MPMRDPALTVAIVRYGWVAGHRHHRLRCLGAKLRKCGVGAAFLILFLAIAASVCRSPEHRNHTTEAGGGVVGAESGEVHALREADDFCHGVDVAPAATGLPTMIGSAFQGEA